jgi:hypothetical protein
MLYARRERQRELIESEVRGQSFWTQDFRPELRVKLWHALEEASGSPGIRYSIVDHARWLLLKDEGVHFLTGPAEGHEDDFFHYLGACSETMMPSVIEGMVAGMYRLVNEYPFLSPAHFCRTINDLLNEHRVSYELVGHEIIPFKSKELHASVVTPALQLLAGRRDFAATEKAYLDSLDQISKGHPDNAITDAGTALQEMLKAVGCEGNALGPLLDSARKKRLIAPHDLPLGHAIGKTIDWVAADRSMMGDAHKASEASTQDAWLIVHVVGALIVRLAGGPRESDTAR